MLRTNSNMGYDSSIKGYTYSKSIIHKSHYPISSNIINIASVNPLQNTYVSWQSRVADFDSRQHLWRSTNQNFFLECILLFLNTPLMHLIKHVIVDKIFYCAATLGQVQAAQTTKTFNVTTYTHYNHGSVHIIH